MKSDNTNFLHLILKIALVVSISANIWLVQKVNFSKSQIDLNQNSIISAKEIYPLFECPCCGKSIDECTCPMAKERRTYVDLLIEVGQSKSKDEIIMVYTKKYGLNSFMDKQKQQELREKLIAIAPADRPVISLSPEIYNFGDISQKQGITTTFFELDNQGKSDLIIDKIETSCGCTSAAIVYQDQEGPHFAMPGHGINEEIGDWQVVIPAGEKAQLKVYYDPDVHTDFRGEAVRTISIFSNDPIDFEKKVTIELNQVD